VLRSRARAGPHLEIRSLNEKYEQLALAVKRAILPPKEFKRALKNAKTARKARNRPDSRRPCLYVLRFHGDLRASAVASLREEVSAVLTVATSADAVLVVLESAGGTIHGYGLAASQLQRLRAGGIPLTVAVDRIAASGGYMMACVAERIIAAPFAIIGSIGVVAQLPNVNRLLKKHDIDYELHTAGEYKRTLTVFGENTERGRAKFQAEIEDAHALFKEFVGRHRPQLELDRVATGEYWFAERALAQHLVDELRASDDYLLTACADRNVYEVRWMRRRSWMERMAGPAPDGGE
jgi:serine protease SohB